MESFFTLNEKQLQAILVRDCRQRMIEAAEPVIQGALKVIEARLREQIGSVVISMIESSIEVYGDGQHIKITVLHKEAKNSG